MPNLAQHLSPFDGLSRHCEEWSKTLETSQKRWKMAVLSMKKEFTVLPVDPVRGEYEIPQQLSSNPVIARLSAITGLIAALYLSL